MIWFTADTHFGHETILELCKRPFVNINVHDSALIDNWNSVVAPNDEIYHLGDFAFAKKDRIEHLLKMLNGVKFFIKGNHDGSMTAGLGEKYFQFYKYYHEMKVQDEEMDVKQPIILCHYPFESWNKRYHGAWHLHGHCHGNIASDDSQARLDVGVDVHNYTPISYEDVKRHMTMKVFKPIKHFAPPGLHTELVHGEGED